MQVTATFLLEQKMHKVHLLLSGKSLVRDVELFEYLFEIAFLHLNPHPGDLLPLLKYVNVDGLLVELDPENTGVLTLVTVINERHPDLVMILIDAVGDQSLIAQAVQNGVRDVFRKPYPRELLTQRIVALLTDAENSRRHERRRILVHDKYIC
jgi:DNA-binding response OmpR family regulator